MFNSLYAQRQNAAMIRIAQLYRNIADDDLVAAADHYACQRRRYGIRDSWYHTVLYLKIFH